MPRDENKLSKTYDPETFEVRICNKDYPDDPIVRNLKSYPETMLYRLAALGFHTTVGNANTDGWESCKDRADLLDTGEWNKSRGRGNGVNIDLMAESLAFLNGEDKGDIKARLRGLSEEKLKAIRKTDAYRSAELQVKARRVNRNLKPIDLTGFM